MSNSMMPHRLPPSHSESGYSNGDPCPDCGNHTLGSDYIDPDDSTNVRSGTEGICTYCGFDARDDNLPDPPFSAAQCSECGSHTVRFGVCESCDAEVDEESKSFLHRIAWGED